MNKQIKQDACPQIHYFGATYPDATCINGYLWDLDSHEGEKGLTIGGEDPCPFCNAENFINVGLDSGTTRDEIIETINKLKQYYEKR